jgi:hypothetical protein
MPLVVGHWAVGLFGEADGLDRFEEGLDPRGGRLCWVASGARWGRTSMGGTSFSALWHVLIVADASDKPSGAPDCVRP